MRKILLLILILLNIQTKAQCWKTATAGDDNTIAIKTDGSLWAWGNNANGRLGLYNAYGHKPTNTVPSNDWKTVVFGWSHTVALKTDGSLWAWGYGIYGQIGNGTSSLKDKNAPQQIGSATNWQTIAARENHTIAIKTDGTLWAWGKNLFGQLGDGTSKDKTVPTQIGTATDWKAISTGKVYTVALKTDGSLWAWGNNGNGQLGDNTMINKTVPTQIGTSMNWKTVSAGYTHTVALKTDGSLWAWGNNWFGQLGDGTSKDKTVPTQIGTATDWKTISSGSAHTVALKTDGSLWAWGNNGFGELGNGTNVTSGVPIQIGSSTDWQTISAGGNNTIAIKTNGTLWTWGENSIGQLGDGTIINKNIPTLINCPEAFTATTAQTNLNCTGVSNGSISITSVTGGTVPYSYLWSNGATTNTITGLKAGNYSCTITDATSIAVTKNFSITVGVDTQIPTISYMPNITVNTNSNCTATNVSLGTPVTSDNCSVVSVTNNAPSTFPLGNTKVTWTVKDASNNVATITQSVTVNDGTVPNIKAPANITVNADSNGTATGVTLGTPVTADNCSVASVTNNAPITFPLGNTIVTWTVKDGSNNIATAKQIVTVKDATPPTLIPVAIFTASTTAANTNESINFKDNSINTPTFWAWEITRAGSATLTSSLQNPTFIFVDPGTYTVKLTATNGAGSNTITVTNMITVFISLPPNNFIIESKGETCLNQNNGEINIVAKASYNYVTTINGTKYPLINNSLKVANLAPATYNVSIGITGELFEQNYTVTIPKGATITAKSTVTSRLASVEISEGTAPYTVFVNGEEQFETTSDTFSVSVNKGDFLEVKTAKACEGIYLKEIDTDLLESVLAHPNPTNGKFEIEVPISIKKVVIDLYTMDSKIISKKTYTPTNGRVPFNIENQASGVYIAKIYLSQPKYLKIIKK